MIKIKKYCFILLFIKIIISLQILSQTKLIEDYIIEKKDNEKKKKYINLKECFLKGLKYNLDIEESIYDPKIREFDIILAKSEFDPIFSVSGTISSADKDRTVYGADNIKNETIQLGIYKKNILGGRIGIFYNFNYTKQTDNHNIPYNPLWEHQINLQITQPLLKNLGIDVNLTKINIAQNSWKISIYEFRDKLIKSLSNIEKAYWVFVNAKINYKLYEESLKIAQELYKITKNKIKVGVLPESSILDAERNIAFKENLLIVAKRELENAEDILKNLINPLNLECYENIELVPTQFIEFYPKIELDFRKELKFALKNRPEIKQLQLALKNTALKIREKENSLLPNLDLTFNLGIGGWGEHSNTAWENVYKGDYPFWSLKLSLEFPIGNRKAKSEYNKAVLEHKKNIVAYKKMENKIIYDIKKSIRDIKSAIERVKKSRESRKLAEAQLEDEKKRYKIGTISLFQVQTTQDKLTQAKIEEAKALLEYILALLQLKISRGSYLEDIQKEYNISLKY